MRKIVSEEDFAQQDDLHIFQFLLDKAYSAIRCTLGFNGEPILFCRSVPYGERRALTNYVMILSRKIGFPDGLVAAWSGFRDVTAMRIPA